MAELDPETTTRRFRLWVSMLYTSDRLIRAGVEATYPPDDVERRVQESHAYNGRRHVEALIAASEKIAELEDRVETRTG